MQNFEKLIPGLVDGGVEFVIVGGFAAVIHGVTLVTRDLDVCIPFTVKNCEALLQSVQNIHPFHRMDSNRSPLKETPESLSHFKNLYLNTDLGTIDFLGRIDGVGSYPEVLKYAVKIKLFNRSCNVLDIDALIKAKKEMKEAKDKQAVIQLEAIKQKQTKK
ncbi:MAG: hypothetical protein A2W61_08415 [Deltaproteobacteria bacterium RIFCSPLOWO2_01_44_7]|nr:MAG: hypothetical protein A2712_03550 [Deltaproteobacteria bacterium RIFCSPHIGHO2_01_FULL_43_49]OGQ16267.1 MAG: hypothetical protein A3D22_01520 [Deltaproteobacteria bacterium RIFCSPHIGHO2_02_FULL_44_53]OGQ29227.1 MAG: hypothetical protein A3D98_05305 [Deltaproteobacteria bacterium RIFCSPHIGHO2_12_FULL_44_21]OGQ32784.1 MAG: hypothetical protein A2979_09450 [Deltaproteobacteria bacterium RIFCSPLOWO2_01_FULL_45_74]OGQ41885.1 MAG: hypothetical protein A3I70_09235 [Deltaproteobacteria bacterium 